jgi:hypothetical protein
LIGAFGEVKVVQDNRMENIKRACKLISKEIINSNEETRESVYREFHILSKMVSSLL